VTQLTPFVPSNVSPPTFNATLDGSPHSITVTWNVSAMRYYLNVYDVYGTWILTTPLVTSPTGEAVSAISYDPQRRLMNVTKASGLQVKPGTIVDYTLTGFDPPAVNGLWRCLHLDTWRFTFPIPQDPGPVMTLGSVNRILNMIGSVFQQSTLIYRNGSFEVSP
jgi:hypothetical protein